MRFRDSSISRSFRRKRNHYPSDLGREDWRTSFEDNNNYGIRIINSPVHILDSDISNNAAGGMFDRRFRRPVVHLCKGLAIIGNSVTTTGVSSGLSENSSIVT